MFKEQSPPIFFARILLIGLFSISVILAGTIPSANIALAEDLPELGDNATKYLNPSQEEQIGKEFFRFLLNDPSFLDDFELQSYLQNLGEEIGTNADLRGTKLTFNLIKQNNLNAFAVPGGYITFNTGLVMTTDTESELASVVGHEIAHLTQRHLPRLIAKANENKIPAIAAIIGSILIGGQAGLAGITLTSASVASNQLAFTRGFEREADSIGIKLLAESNHDPSAMAAFFGKLEKYTRHDNTDIPEFLRTHPLSYNRVAESEARAQSYPAQNHKSSFEYYLAKSKIRALYVERQKDPVPHFQEQMESEQVEIKDAAQYGIALAYTEERKLSEAHNALAPLVVKYPNHPWIQSAQAEIDIANNLFEQGIQRYEQTIEHNPGQLYLNYRLANAYLANDQAELAKKLMRYQIRRHPDDFRLYHLLSKANANLGILAEAHQADADYYATLGNYKKAIAAIKLALRESNSEGYLQQSLTARLNELEERLEIQKRIEKG